MDPTRTEGDCTGGKDRLPGGGGGGPGAHLRRGLAGRLCGRAHLRRGGASRLFGRTHLRWGVAGQLFGRAHGVLRWEGRRGSGRGCGHRSVLGLAHFPERKTKKNTHTKAHNKDYGMGYICWWISLVRFSIKQGRLGSTRAKRKCLRPT